MFPRFFPDSKKFLVQSLVGIVARCYSPPTTLALLRSAHSNFFEFNILASPLLCWNAHSFFYRKFRTQTYETTGHSEKNAFEIIRQGSLISNVARTNLRRHRNPGITTLPCSSRNFFITRKSGSTLVKKKTLTLVLRVSLGKRVMLTQEFASERRNFFFTLPETSFVYLLARAQSLFVFFTFHDLTIFRSVTALLDSECHWQRCALVRSKADRSLGYQKFYSPSGEVLWGEQCWAFGGFESEYDFVPSTWDRILQRPARFGPILTLGQGAQKSAQKVKKHINYHEIYREIWTFCRFAVGV